MSKFAPLSTEAYGQNYPLCTLVAEHYVPVPRYGELVEQAGTPDFGMVHVPSRELVGAMFSAYQVGVGDAAAYRSPYEEGHMPDLPHLIGCLSFCGTIEHPGAERYQSVIALPFETDPAAVPASLRVYMHQMGWGNEVVRVQYYQDAGIIEPKMTSIKSPRGLKQQ